MFSKLVFTIDGEEIEFHLHEIVRIAMSMLKSDVGDAIPVIPPSRWNFIFDDIKQMGPFAFSAARGQIDSLLLMPVHMRGMTNPKQWLFAAKYLYNSQPKADEDTPVGWWVSVSDRLILINNRVGRERFYVSDHGDLSDIIQNVTEIAIELNWVSNPELALEIVKIKKDLDSMSPEELAAYKARYAESVANEPIEVLKKFHPDKSEEELKAIQDDFRKNEEYKETDWKRSNQMFIYIVETVMKKFCELKFKTLPDFDIRIYKLFENNIVFADKLIKYTVLADLAKEINQGKHEPLYRPIFSYGAREKGDAYREFAVTVGRYLSRADAVSEAILASLMKALLAGGKIDNDRLAFLPNLVGAWFIAEVGRNPVSILSGLMLLDFIESETVLLHDSANLYSWKYVLVHPRKPINSIEKVEIQDMYGDPIDLANFDGMHPMAHGGSVPDSRKLLDEGKKLNPVRQKEGWIILHWLYLVLKQKYPQMQIRLETISSSSLVGKPSYKEIDKLFEAADKPSKSIKQDKKLEKKWKLLAEFVKPLLQERLSDVKNMINPGLNCNITLPNSGLTSNPVLPTQLDNHPVTQNFEAAKEESLRIALKKGEIGPREIQDWELKDVPDNGNCFYDAVCHQLFIYNHIYLGTIPSSTLPRDSLRLLIQGSRFTDGEYADIYEIFLCVIKLNVAIAIVDTRYPALGFRCYYPDGMGNTHETYNPADVPTNTPILRLAYTGNHYLSVRHHPPLQNGALRRTFTEPFMLMFRYPFWTTPLQHNLLTNQTTQADKEGVLGNGNNNYRLVIYKPK